MTVKQTVVGPTDIVSRWTLKVEPAKKVQKAYKVVVILKLESIEI